MNTIDPLSVAVCTPTYDGKLGALYVLGLTHVVAQRGLAMPYFQSGCSNVALARNRCVQWFLQSPYQHLAFIDADIGFSLEDWRALLEDDGSDAVCAEYRKKDQLRRIRVHFGLGFARISRRVFEAMAELRQDDGQDLLKRFRMDGQEWIDYFPQGVTFEGSWRGEDHGFWLCAKVAGCQVRIEQRCRLIHTGEAHFPYRSEDFADESSAYASQADADLTQPPDIADWSAPPSY
jgi:hypothetical protein